MTGNTSASGPSVATVVNFDCAWRGKDNRGQHAVLVPRHRAVPTVGIVIGLAIMATPALGSFNGVRWLAWAAAIVASINVERVP